MTEQIEIGSPPIQIKVKRSTRARRYSLRISNKDGMISLTVPKFAPMPEAIKFASEHEGWMRKHLSKQLKPLTIELGSKILFDGEYKQIESGSGRTVRLENNIFYVPGPSDRVSTKLRAYFKVVARDRLAGWSTEYAEMLDKRIGRITIRDTRSRWGSCTSDGNLMYSWRLMMAPPQVQAYVAAHEVCHLIEMNHSRAYWALVAKVFPDYKAQRSWLKKNGVLLHRFSFSA